MNEPIDFVGIDVSKRQLDSAIGLDGNEWSETNDQSGIRRLVARLKTVNPKLVVVEATGGFEVPLITALYEAGLPFARVHPGRVREFARSIGLLAKTDRLDARLLARFGQAVQPPETRLPSLEEQQLSALMTRRRQVIEMLTAEKNRLGSAPSATQKRIGEHIRWLEQELSDLNRDINDFIKRLPTLNDKQEILTSTPGVGPVSSAILLADLPELGRYDRKQIAALVGLAPFNSDSGPRRGKRRIKGGRESIRNILYMATLSAIKCNPVIRAFYRQLCDRGKEKMVAVVACMRKLLTILNAMVRDNKPWQPVLLSHSV